MKPNSEHQVGPALSRLRKAKRWSQVAVAEKLGKAKSTISGLESPRSNPTIETVLEYLRAISATLSDLERELGGAPDPIERERRAIDERIASDPAFRSRAAELSRRYETAQLPDLLELIVRSEARHSGELSAVQARLSRLEDALLRREDLAPNGTEDD